MPQLFQTVRLTSKCKGGLAVAALLGVFACGGNAERPGKGGSEIAQEAGARPALTAASVSASGNDGNVPGNVLDGNLSTRWSSVGIGQNITLDLGSLKTICSLQIAWFEGNTRTNTFTIAVSGDGSTFVQVFSGQ